MINNVGLVAVRDPHGIRPLIIGKRDEDLMGAEYMIASESSAIDALDFKIIDDIAAGETIFISKEGKRSRSKSQKAADEEIVKDLDVECKQQTFSFEKKQQLCADEIEAKCWRA